LTSSVIRHTIRRMIHNSETTERQCKHCGKRLERKRYPSGLIETPSAFGRRLHCDRTCRGKTRDGGRVEGDDTVRRCTRCMAVKSFTGFYKDSRAPAGLQRWCKDCRREYDQTPERRDAAARRRQSPEGKAAQAAYQRQNRHTPERKATLAKYHRSAKGKAAQARRKERHPERVRARSAANHAIRDGLLIPQPCEVCGEFLLGDGGRRLVDAHHDDYSKPLDVRWLCGEHHAEHHRALLAHEPPGV